MSEQNDGDAIRAALRYRLERFRREELGEEIEPEPDPPARAPTDAERAAAVEIAIQQSMRRGDFDDCRGPASRCPGFAPTVATTPTGGCGARSSANSCAAIGPAAYTLRTEDAELDAQLDALHRADDVRAVLDDFNLRVIEARRQLLGGPPVTTSRVTWMPRSPRGRSAEPPPHGRGARARRAPATAPVRRTAATTRAESRRRSAAAGPAASRADARACRRAQQWSPGSWRQPTARPRSADDSVIHVRAVRPGLATEQCPVATHRRRCDPGQLADVAAGRRRPRRPAPATMTLPRQRERSGRGAGRPVAPPRTGCTTPERQYVAVIEPTAADRGCGASSRRRVAASRSPPSSPPSSRPQNPRAAGGGRTEATTAPTSRALRLARDLHRHEQLRADGPA